MRLEQLLYLLEIGKQKNITRAAEKLYIAQSTLSENIKNLELELGVPLLIRNHKGITLTTAGEKTIVAAEKIFLQLEILEKELALIKNNTTLPNLPENHFTLETVSFIGSTHLIPFFEVCQKKNLDLSTTIRDAQEIVERILEKKISTGIILSEQQYWTKIQHASHSITSFLLKKGDLKVMVHKEHPLSQHNIVSIQQFLQYPLLFFQNGCIPIRSILQKYGNLNTIIESNIFSLPERFLCYEQGVYLCSSIILDYFPDNPFGHENLIVKELDITIPVNLYLIMREEYVQTNAGTYFRDIILNNFIKSS